MNTSPSQAPAEMIVGVIRSISREELSEADQEKNRALVREILAFLATASHQVRNNP